MIFLFLFLFFSILLYLLIEKKINDMCLASFDAVIHVNGIRGKTSTCRYLDAALRARYRVFTKTTGTDAMYIDVDGKESPVRRFGPANIHEQIRTIRRARKEGAQILILECMAVNPELQKAAQEQIVKSKITVITNVRYDHIFEMGETLEEIAASLSCTIPENGTLYTADAQAAALFQKTCDSKNTKLVLCPATGTETENIGIAREIARSLGVTDTEFDSRLPFTAKDFGSCSLYSVKSKDESTYSFLNLFSANDPQSTRYNIEAVHYAPDKLYFFYNHREDRPDRALLFARYFFPHYKNCPVFISGQGASLAKRLFTGAGVKDIQIYQQGSGLPSLPDGSLLVGIGNIKGTGYQIIQDLEERTHE